MRRWGDKTAGGSIEVEGLNSTFSPCVQEREALFFFSLESETKAKCQKLTGVRLELKQRQSQSSKCLETLVKGYFFGSLYSLCTFWITSPFYHKLDQELWSQLKFWTDLKSWERQDLEWNGFYYYCRHVLSCQRVGLAQNRWWLELERCGLIL